MVGKGVLLECLESAEVEAVLIINRRPLGIEHVKLKEIVHGDFHDLSSIKTELEGYNACYFCLGVSSVGMKEESYSHVTYDLTLHVAEILVELNKDMTFCYVSGTGTDNSEKGRSMWARVKGRTENALLALPFKAAYMFRPGYIQPMKGIRSATKLYNAMYMVFKPLYPLFKSLAPKYVTSTVQVGEAMINSVSKGYEKKFLENLDINIVSSRQ